ncbi:hypothetical protein [Streptomyces sp. NBC_00568]|uniref:hypothetical protein n=1 Tax=Streptomyces sp. NBC_00568 TaxID=2975779 RepID=UPI00224EF1A6|nr:hypothetical protein [Streptomyces sp. NBC_00568]MCX4993467.1 hypothetical protein [Streptomyces sp. NBC_00568]
MIKNLLGVLLALSVVPLAAPAAGASVEMSLAVRFAAASKEAAPPAGTDVPLRQALAWVDEVPEGPRAGYRRERFKHWNKGLDPTDGCDTRKEIIRAEAVLTDQVWVTSAASRPS